MITYQFDPASSGVAFPHTAIDEFIEPKVLGATLAEYDVLDRQRCYAKSPRGRLENNKVVSSTEAVGRETAGAPARRSLHSMAATETPRTRIS